MALFAADLFESGLFEDGLFEADAEGPAALSVYANPLSSAETIADYDGDDAGHIAAYARAILAGADFLYAIRKWSLMEATEGVYTFDYFTRLADNSDALPLHYAIALLDSDAGKHLPSDLASTDLDAAGTISAFNAMITALATALGADAARVELVVLGNEVDYYIAAGTVATRRAELVAFLAGVVPTVQAQFPNATVTTCFSKEAVDDWATNSYGDIQAEVDAPSFTLQWFNSSTFAALALDSTLFDHVAALQTAIGLVSWHLIEAGYPSATLPGGSEANQSSFITAVADTIRTAYTPYLRSIQFTWMNTLPDVILESAPPAGYGLTPATNVHAVFGSLGFRTLADSPKAAWPVLVGYMDGDTGDVAEQPDPQSLTVGLQLLVLSGGRL